MLVQIFPYDRRLRTLGPVMGAAGRDVDPLLLTRLGPGEWEVEDRTIETARYRTERGAVLRYTIRAREIQSARRETLTCYLKVYRNERGADTWRFLQLMSAKVEGSPQPYDVIRPIAYLMEHRTLVAEEAPGTSLTQLLLRAGDPAEAVRPVARALAAFHQDDVPATRQESLADALKTIRKAATLVEWICPGARDAIQAITAEVRAGLREAPPTPIHGDLKPDHLFVSGPQVVFIDLDSVAFGDPVRDVASFFAHLASRAGLRSMPAGPARAPAPAFAQAYFRHAPRPWRGRLPPHTASACLEVAAGIVRAREPCWRVTGGVISQRRGFRMGRRGPSSCSSSRSATYASVRARASSTQLASISGDIGSCWGHKTPDKPSRCYAGDASGFIDGVVSVSPESGLQR